MAVFSIHGSLPHPLIDLAIANPALVYTAMFDWELIAEHCNLQEMDKGPILSQNDD